MKDGRRYLDQGQVYDCDGCIAVIKLEPCEQHATVNEVIVCCCVDVRGDSTVSRTETPDAIDIRQQ